MSALNKVMRLFVGLKLVLINRFFNGVPPIRRSNSLLTPTPSSFSFMASASDTSRLLPSLFRSNESSSAAPSSLSMSSPSPASSLKCPRPSPRCHLTEHASIPEPFEGFYILLIFPLKCFIDISSNSFHPFCCFSRLLVKTWSSSSVLYYRYIYHALCLVSKTMYQKKYYIKCTNRVHMNFNSNLPRITFIHSVPSFVSEKSWKVTRRLNCDSMIRNN